ncbi:MAG: serine hydrolase domain-containing protein [Burkholderiales bacterium]
MAPILGYRSIGVGLFIALTLPLCFSPIAAWGQSDDVVPTAVDETGRTDVRAQEIDSMLSKYFAPGEPGATVIVSQRGAILFRKAYGLANIEMNMPLRPEMSLRTGSVTKQFTAAAIMLLVEQGRLSVSDEIGKYFPQYPEQARHVTIEHLLTHTSGIRNYTELAHFGAAMTKDVSVDEAIAFFDEVPLQFQPGQRFSYSNSNYFLLGAIIEKVSGMRYSDFMQQRIFQPLQMRSTVVETSTSPVSSVIGYTQDRKGIASVNHYSMNWPFAAGALRTSVDDLVRWDSAITTGKLLGRVSWDSMATDRTLNGGSHTGYGYGWFIRRLGGSHALEHGGDIGGFSADTWRFPKEELFVAVLTNNDSHEPAADSIAEKIAKILLRR